MPHWLSVTLAVIGGLATAFGLYAGGRKALSDARATKRSAPPTWAEIWNRMDAQDAKITELTDRVSEQDKTIYSMRDTENRLIGWIAVVHDGINQGAVPPLPPIPIWLEPLLDQPPARTKPPTSAGGSSMPQEDT